jgi:hypothetical protein
VVSPRRARSQSPDDLSLLGPRRRPSWLGGLDFTPGPAALGHVCWDSKSPLPGSGWWAARWACALSPSAQGVLKAQAPIPGTGASGQVFRRRIENHPSPETSIL